MHKIYSQLKGFDLFIFVMRGYDIERNQLSVSTLRDGDGIGSGLFSFDGNGFGRGEYSYGNGDGIFSKKETCLEEANA
jgi:hypothetical protein